MTGVFLRLLSMSLTGSLVLLAVLLLRLPLRRAPRKWVCLLWLPVLFRLLCPVTLESRTSLVPEGLEMDALAAAWSGNYGGEGVSSPARTEAYDPAPILGGGPQGSVSFPETPAAPPVSIAPAAGEASGAAAAPADRADARGPEIPWQAVLSRVWLTGTGVFLLWGLFQVLRLRRRLREAVRLEGNVYEAEGISSPFVLGIFRPRIYLPWGLAAEARQSVLLHERAHLRRLDPLWKLLGWLTLGLHWFNPLCWLAFLLAVGDLELACDEAVISSLGEGEKKNYSRLLLDLSAGKPLFTATPLGFGEGNVKNRIRGVLRWTKPRRWVLVLVLALLAIVVLLLVLGPKKGGPEPAPTPVPGEIPSPSPAPSSDPEPSPLPHYPVEEGWTLLGEEELAKWTNALATFPRTADGGWTMFDEKGNSTYNLVGCCFTSFYKEPADLDLHAFLKYFDDYDGDATEEEYQLLLAAGTVDGRRWSHVEDLPYPLRRIRADTVEARLQEYFGIGLSDLRTDYRTRFRYLPETDCFYSITSDFGPGVFTPGWGEKQGDTLRLWSGYTSLTLRVSGEDWKILSHWNAYYDPNAIEMDGPAPRGRNTYLPPEAKWILTTEEAEFCDMEEDRLLPKGTIGAGERLTVLEEERTPEGEIWFKVHREAFKVPDGRDGWVRGEQVIPWTDMLYGETLAPVYVPAGTTYYPLDFSDYAPDGVEDRVKEENAASHAYDLPCAILEVEGDWARVGVSGGMEMWVERWKLQPGTPDDEPPGKTDLLIAAAREAALEQGWPLLRWGAEVYFRPNTLRYDVYLPAEGGAFVRAGFPNPETVEPGCWLPDEIEWIQAN